MTGRQKAGAEMVVLSPINSHEFSAFVQQK